MKKLLILTAAILALQAVPALAEDTAPAKEGKKHMENPMFAEQDSDKNGTVSEAEFVAFGKKKFSEIDRDGNGEITKEEAKKHHESRREKWKKKREEMKEKRDAMKSKSEDAPKSE